MHVHGQEGHTAKLDERNWSRQNGKAPPLNSPTLLTGVAKFENRAIRLLYALTKSNTRPVNQQLDSPLFRLPPEIRDSIWGYALDPHEHARHAHFHIYDTVYDWCTYERFEGHTDMHGNPLLRRLPKQMALLLTCRAVYEEILHFLYDKSRFTLVVLPGLPRPGDDVHLSTSGSLGRIHDCQAMFRMMRNVTIIIQPGRMPHTQKYLARITKLLQAFDYGRCLDSLRLQFNFHAAMQKYDPDYTRRVAIIESFYLLGPCLVSNGVDLIIDAWSLDRVAWPSKFSELQAVLGGAKINAWHPIHPSQNGVKVDPSENRSCLQRGSIGRHACGREQRESRTAQEKSQQGVDTMVAAALFLVTLPVSLPYVIALYARRKRNKGEW